jgi:glycosyltransferase involved in cell wall biosynthesis
MSQDPLHLLCVEPRFPGRLGWVADWLVRRRGYHCRFLCADADPPELWPSSTGEKLEVVRCPASAEAAVGWTHVLSRSLAHARAYFEYLDRQRPRPIDLVLGRSAGLGSTLFVPAALPGVPVVNLFDYICLPRSNDLTADVRPDIPDAYWHWRRSANAIDLLDLENGALPWTATAWQRDLYPPEYRADFRVQHDGIATDLFRRPAPIASAPRTLLRRTLPADARVVTFVSRGLDRLRGFDRFVRLANRLLRARTDVLCVVLGAPVVHRGLDVEFFGQDYRAHVLAREPLHDPARVWFVDLARPAQVAEVLAASALHVSLSRPYPVARSLLEAMAAGCVVLAADTPPAREVIDPGRTGLLAPADDLDAWERLALAALDDPAAHRPLGEAAAEQVRRHYARDVTVPILAEWFDGLAGGGAEPCTSSSCTSRSPDSSAGWRFTSSAATAGGAASSSKAPAAARRRPRRSWPNCRCTASGAWTGASPPGARPTPPRWSRPSPTTTPWGRCRTCGPTWWCRTRR